MTAKWFPIKTETACQLKWTWSTLRLYNGASSSCHRVNLTTLSTENFNDFHNTEKSISDRKLMLEGQWPKGGCEYCQQSEAAGGQSDRLFQLKIPNLAPPELEHNPTAVTVTPRILEVYLDNVCNMSCLYCWDGFSSRIYQENQRFGDFDQDGVVIKNSSGKHPQFDELTEKFWIWLDKNYNSLSRLHILGGEPFFQSQFEQCIEFLESHSNPELEFNVVTNLKVSSAKLEDFVLRIKKLLLQRRIKRFDITCSIDCFGPEQEYVRFGLDLNQWRKNFEYLLSHKWITVNINQTLANLVIKTVPDMLQYINQVSRGRQVGHFFQPPNLTYPFLHPKVFGAGFFDEDFKNILAEMKDTTMFEKEFRNNMNGIWNELNSSVKSPTMINQLSIYLTELDRRRNTDWKKTFPWLVKEVENVV